MAEKCTKCFRPVKTCYCNDIKEVDTGVSFIILMHPREAYRQKTGTGRLAHLCLTDSEILVGVNFSNNRRVNELISKPDNFAVTLYPDEDAIYANNITQAGEYKNRHVVVFLIDATWLLAKKMLKMSPNISALPKVSFSKKYKSQFHFKKQPDDYCLSTIESIYYLINEFKECGLIKNTCNPDYLMEVFKKMVNFQIECEEENKK